MGGTARRSALIKQIRAREQNVLLLDAGDIFQGTPYFNKFGGELEMRLMTAMGYDAATMGTTILTMAWKASINSCHMPISQYCAAINDFSNTLLKEATQPYKVFKKGGLKTVYLVSGLS